jgi:DNA repair protein RadC
MKISIVGAGNGGQAIAGYLSMLGYEVSLYDRDISKIEELKSIGFIKLEGKIKGIGKVKAIQIKAICELSIRMSKPSDYRKIVIHEPYDLAKIILQELRFEKREIAKLIMLDNKNTLLKVIDISLGGTNFAIIEPKNVLSEPIKMNVPKIILIHNHPSRRHDPE